MPEEHINSGLDLGDEVVDCFIVNILLCHSLKYCSITQESNQFGKIESDVIIENGIRISEDFKPGDANHLIYKVDDIPPWHWSLLLGFQVEYLSKYNFK